MDAKSKTTKETIMETAIDLFCEKGYAAASVRDLAEAVGIKESSIYYYFKGKHDILLEIIDMAFQIMFEARVDPYKVAEMPTEEALVNMFWRAPPNRVSIFRKIVRIILVEQYTDEDARRFVKVRTLETAKITYMKVFEILIEKGKLAPFDTEMVSTVLSRLVLAYGVDVSHLEKNFDEVFEERDRVLNFVLSQIPRK